MFKKYNFSLSLRFVCLYFLLAMAFANCVQKTRDYKSPAGYNLNNPYVIKLPNELEEVSGIAYYRKDNSLFMESDAKGALYKMFLNKPTDIRKWKFSHKRDYEDIVLHDSTFYVLNNNGDIVSLNFVNDSLVAHEFTFPPNGKNEFESMYFDDQLQKLVLICKECENDKEATVSAYYFDLNLSVYAAGFVIEAKSILELTSPKSHKFKPSAAAIHPVTGELYILSSINKLLVVAERNGAVKEVYHLDPSVFNQPEGIAFTPGGNLFISNEAGKPNPATILFYQYKTASNK